MREARKLGVNLCRWHCRGRVRDKVDARREPRLHTLADSDNDILRSRAERALACIARRKTNRAWKLDPWLPGSTVPSTSATQRALNDGSPSETYATPARFKRLGARRRRVAGTG